MGPRTSERDFSAAYIVLGDCNVHDDRNVLDDHI